MYVDLTISCVVGTDNTNTGNIDNTNTYNTDNTVIKIQQYKLEYMKNITESWRRLTTRIRSKKCEVKAISPL
jgi:hypothetical protein